MPFHARCGTRAESWYFPATCTSSSSGDLMRPGQPRSQIVPEVLSSEFKGRLADCSQPARHRLTNTQNPEIPVILKRACFRVTSVASFGSSEHLTTDFLAVHTPILATAPPPGLSPVGVPASRV